MEIIILGIVASLLAGLSTSLGAIPVLLGKEFSDRSLDIMLGFAAGVMLAASAFSLLVPALEMDPIYSNWSLEPVINVMFGFGSGA